MPWWWNTELTSLNLSNTRITDRGVGAISEGLKINETLTGLHLCRIDLKIADIRRLEGMLAINDVVRLAIDTGYPALEGCIPRLNKVNQAMEGLNEQATVATLWFEQMKYYIFKETKEECSERS